MKAKQPFKIEDNIPLPTKQYYPCNPVKYGLEYLKPGQSFEFPADIIKAMRATCGNLTLSLRRRGQKEAKFSIRKMSAKTYRCWRVK